MNKNAIKKYAVWARRDLIDRVSQRALRFGVSTEGNADPKADAVGGRLFSDAEKKQRAALIAKIEAHGYEQTIEEVAYTWFNRFAALRFMEVNGYLPSHVRVFTNDAGEFKPQILAEAIHLDLPGLDMDRVYALKDANKTEELYRYLIVVQCNALNEILPGMFQRIDDYTELLLPDNQLREGSVIERLVRQGDSDSIPEEDWRDQVQIIGWLYQYYNTEPKDKVFADLKKNIKMTKEKIPAATQLFTPDWIVRYMVENSLGRLWLEGHPNEKLQSEWKYYLPEAEQEEEVQKQLAEIRKEYADLKPTDIRCIDPCMGSGHILCYLFDVLMQIYQDYGHTPKDAVIAIVEHNLFGLDIDERAAQLSYFAVMMKARQYDRRFFSRHLQPNVMAIQESNGLRTWSEVAGDSLVSGQLTFDDRYIQMADDLIETFHDAKEYGSILTVKPENYDDLIDFIERMKQEDGNLLFRSWIEEIDKRIMPLIQQAKVLAAKYDVVVTNPPYMAITNANNKLYDYITTHHPKAKTDLFSTFIERCELFSNPNKYYSMITQQSWLSLSSFLELRKEILAKDIIVSMAQIGAKGFDEISGEVVSSVAFIMRNRYIAAYKGTYSDLQSGNSEAEKEEIYLSRKYYYEAVQDNFALIPNNVVVYNASNNALRHFENDAPLSSFVTAKPGMQTSDNDRFLRLWFEVIFNRIGFGFDHNSASVSKYKWFPYNKGIGFRKWFGNNDYIVNFYHDGKELKYWLTHNPKDPKTKHWSRNMRNYNSYFEDGITFTAIGNSFSARLNGKGYLFDTKGPMMFGKDLLVVCGFVNSVVFDYYNRMLCKQITKSFDSVNLVPFSALDENKHGRILGIVNNNVELSKTDWDSFETSWDFQDHPFIKWSRELWDATAIGATMYHYYGGHPKVSCPLELCFMLWQGECNERFTTLKQNEEELNHIFIDIYGLQNELTPGVEDKDVTVRKADLARDIRSFISYAVGCMMGRYSLDTPGLVYAGGKWNKGKYKTFQPDDDAILPICDDEYFDDDIVGRFVQFVGAAYGKDTLEENLKFIADALGGRGTPREIIRNYFLTDFFADHVRTYQKRPIYWLFDSGKKNGFKCLVYMHRYRPDTLARIRTDYIHEQQSRYRTAIDDLGRRRDGAATAAERVKLGKKLAAVEAQAKELMEYEEKIHHLADQMIAIDLDDGVKHNYALFKDVLAKI